MHYHWTAPNGGQCVSEDLAVTEINALMEIIPAELFSPRAEVQMNSYKLLSLVLRILQMHLPSL